MGTTAHKKYQKNYTFNGAKVLNLGCGFTKYDAKNVVNLDKFDCCQPDIVHDLEVTPLPFKDETFDYIIANHVFEHLHNWWECFEDCARILKVGGTIDIFVPGAGTDSQMGYRDHVSVINSCSFYGVSNLTPMYCNAWATEHSKCNANALKFVYANKFIKDTPLTRYMPQSIKHWMANHLMNMVEEDQYQFIKVSKTEGKKNGRNNSKVV